MDPGLIFLVTVVSFYSGIWCLKKTGRFLEARQIKKLIFKKSEKLNEQKLKKLQEEGHEECIFCYEEYAVKDKIIKLHCNHVYHKKCLKKWFQESIKCPLCNLPVQTSGGIRLNHLIEYQEEN